MKIIHKQNFFSIVCVIFTLLALGKIVLEAIVMKRFGNEQENFLMMFLLSLLATAVLSQHYRFQNFPLPIMIIVQYLLLIAGVMLITWLTSLFEPLHEDAYRDMFLSFTIPYAIGAAVYYISLFYEVGRANRTLKEIRRYQHENDNDSAAIHE